MSISNNIKALRELNNLTQAEFGKIAGVSDKAVSTWENGTAEPRMGAIQKLADYFKVSKGWIMGDDPVSDNTDALFIDKYGQDVYDAAMAFNCLDDVDKAKVSERIDTLLEDDKYKGASFEEMVI